MARTMRCYFMIFLCANGIRSKFKTMLASLIFIAFRASQPPTIGVGRKKIYVFFRDTAVRYTGSARDSFNVSIVPQNFGLFRTVDLYWNQFAIFLERKPPYFRAKAQFFSQIRWRCPMWLAYALKLVTEMQFVSDGLRCIRHVRDRRRSVMKRDEMDRRFLAACVFPPKNLPRK